MDNHQSGAAQQVVDEALPARLPFPALVLAASTAATDQVHVRLAEAGFPGFRVSYGYTFQLLAVTGGATGVEVAKHLGITKQSASAILDALSAAGYISTTTHPVDSRAKLATLTARGWDCIRIAEGIWQGLEDDLARDLGGEELEVTRRVLESVLRRYGDEHFRLRPPR